MYIDTFTFISYNPLQYVRVLYLGVIKLQP